MTISELSIMIICSTLSKNSIMSSYKIFYKWTLDFGILSVTYPSAQCLPSVFYMILLGTLLLTLLVAALWPELCNLCQSHHQFYR